VRLDAILVQWHEWLTEALVGAAPASGVGAGFIGRLVGSNEEGWLPTNSKSTLRTSAGLFVHLRLWHQNFKDVSKLSHSMKHAVPTAPAVESQSMLQCQSHAQIAVHVQPAAAADAAVVTAPKGTAAAARTVAS
jgi:hypothetical protein